MKLTINKLNKPELNEKTDFNNWSITYLREVIQCSKCKKRNTIVKNSAFTFSHNQRMFQNCMFCGNPNYIK
jgi:hypothetical protein